ncbi:MAG: DUF1285 domain-containing protein [Sandaracinaceae bacterium]|nr:DUF1285 domain-containing protein [Sandaracinaceae bacterium]MDW8246636.1 DUF2946 family protein [Sandaracinaceae bacterium]
MKEPLHKALEFKSEIDLRRDAQGRWWCEGEEITHRGICAAFDAWLDRDEDGRYFLKNAISRVYVQIEGPPLFARGVEVREGAMWAMLSDGTKEQVNLASLRQGEDGRLYFDAREGRMSCVFTDEAMAALSDWLGEDEEGVFLKIGETKARWPVLKDPLDGQKAR